jgi:SnoaL-like domain
MMRPNPADYAEIANLLAEYCLALDRDEIDRCVTLFTEGGSFQVYGRSFEGREAIRKMMVSAPGGLHLGGPPFVENIDGDRARVQQNLLFVDRTTGESRRALYTDDFLRTDDGWRIHTRKCQFLVATGLSDRPDT